MLPSVARSSSSVSVVRRFNAQLMTISPLADLPDAIETLAQWFYDEWHAFDGRRMENIATQLSENLNRDVMPITFVAHRNRLPLGSVSLDRFDFPAFDCLSPWLSSLYVHPSFRGKGIGSSLVRHLQHFAVSHGTGPIYLWTPGSTRLYERCGWVEFTSATYGAQRVKLMKFSNE